MINIFDSLLIIIDDLGRLSLKTLSSYLPDYSFQQISSVVGRLEQRGWLQKKSTEDDVMVQIQPLGDRYLSRTLNAVRLAEQVWDGSWYGTLVHIPEQLRKGRDSLRLWFTNHGFGHSIDGFWVSPYDRSEEIIDEAQRLGVAPYFSLLKFEPLGQATQERLIQQSWNWEPIQSDLQTLLIYVSDQEKNLHKNNQATARRLQAKQLVFVIARNLSKQPNLPNIIGPNYPELKIIQAVYQRLRVFCYE